MNTQDNKMYSTKVVKSMMGDNINLQFSSLLRHLIVWLLCLSIFKTSFCQVDQNDEDVYEWFEKIDSDLHVFKYHPDTTVWFPFMNSLVMDSSWLVGYEYNDITVGFIGNFFPRYHSTLYEIHLFVYSKKHEKVIIFENISSKNINQRETFYFQEFFPEGVRKYYIFDLNHNYIGEGLLDLLSKDVDLMFEIVGENRKFIYAGHYEDLKFYQQRIYLLLNYKEFVKFTHLVIEEPTITKAKFKIEFETRSINNNRIVKKVTSLK